MTIERQNGNIAKSLPGEDHVTGLVAYLAAADIPDAFTTERIKMLSTIDAAEAAGITDDATAAWGVRVLHYQLSEIYRLNPGVSLYVGLFAKPAGATQMFGEIKTVQNFAGGRIRQMGVWCGDRTLSADDLTALQGVADALAAQEAELSIVYAPLVRSVQTLAVDLAGENKSRVSVVIGQAGSGRAAELYHEQGGLATTASTADTGGLGQISGGKGETLLPEITPATIASVSGLGVVLGLLSRAKVHQSIAWVREFPTGVSLPAFGDGTLVRDVDKALLESLDNAGRYLFFVTHTGLAGSYMNDSHTMDSAQSDYAAIESVRTMDKAVRGIRAYVKPELGSNVYVDSATGQLAAYTVAHLETVANQALEAMERNGELSGYKVEIDPEQDVASTGKVEFVIRNVAVPVMRRVSIKIGFAKSV